MEVLFTEYQTEGWKRIEWFTFAKDKAEGSREFQLEMKKQSLHVWRPAPVQYLRATLFVRHASDQQVLVVSPSCWNQIEIKYNYNKIISNVSEEKGNHCMARWRISFTSTTPKSLAAKCRCFDSECRVLSFCVWKELGWRWGKGVAVPTATTPARCWQNRLKSMPAWLRKACCTPRTSRDETWFPRKLAQGGCARTMKRGRCALPVTFLSPLRFSYPLWRSAHTQTRKGICLNTIFLNANHFVTIVRMPERYWSTLGHQKEFLDQVAKELNLTKVYLMATQAHEIDVICSALWLVQGVEENGGSNGRKKLVFVLQLLRDRTGYHLSWLFLGSRKVFGRIWPSEERGDHIYRCSTKDTRTSWSKIGCKTGTWLNTLAFVNFDKWIRLWIGLM